MKESEREVERDWSICLGVLDNPASISAKRENVKAEKKPRHVKNFTQFSSVCEKRKVYLFLSLF